MGIVGKTVARFVLHVALVRLGKSLSVFFSPVQGWDVEKYRIISLADISAAAPAQDGKGDAVTTLSSSGNHNHLDAQLTAATRPLEELSPSRLWKMRGTFYILPPYIQKPVLTASFTICIVVSWYTQLLSTYVNIAPQEKNYVVNVFYFYFIYHWSIKEGNGWNF